MPVVSGTRIYLIGNNTVNRRAKIIARGNKVPDTRDVSDTLLQGCYNVASFMFAISYVIIVYNRRDAY